MPTEAALQTPHRVIRASAGSGKTHQLTGHYLRLLRAGAEPATILATTFTRKAAGEIQAKILTRLVAAIEHEQTRDNLAADTGGGSLARTDCLAMLRRLIGAMHRLAISTIDGFFYRIAHGFCYELDLPLNPQLTDEGSPTARSLRREAISAMLADADLHQLITLLRRVHHDSTAQSVTSALDRIVTSLHETYRQAPDRALWDQLDAPQPLDQPRVEQAITALSACEDELPTTQRGTPDTNFARAFQDDIDKAWNRQWEPFIASGLAAKIAKGEPAYRNKPIPQPLIDAYAPLIQHAKARLLEQVRQTNLARFDLLERFDRHYETLRRRHNVLLFSDLTDALARRMPRLEPGQLADIYFRLDSTVRHLLLDEFQDTSLDQWRVLQPFAEEIAGHGEPDLTAEARSFFCVGDTKQAIYGWRGGCADLLDTLDTQLNLPPDAFESLNQSFRACPVVLEAVNDVFTAIDATDILSASAKHPADGDAAADFAAAFAPHEPAEHLKDTPGHVCLETTHATDQASTNTADTGEPDDADDDEPAPFTEHEAIAAQRVRDLHQRHPQRSIGVLVRTNRMAARLIHELRQLEANARPLVVSGEGGAPLTDCQPVNVILSALTLADHPGPARGQSAAAFHVANAPLGPVLGLTSTQPGNVHRTSLAIRRQLLQHGYANVISRWIEQLAPACDAQSLARLEQLIPLAEQYEPEVTLRPSRFVEYVETTPVEQARPAPIRVMTIHRAKGLQFDIVVLPELDGQLRDDFDLLVERDGPTGDVTAVQPCPRRAIRELSETLQQAHHQRRRQRRYEDLCGLYVALTRAKRSLHMLIRPPGRTGNGNLSKPALSYAQMLREALSTIPREEEREGQTLYTRGRADWDEATHEPAITKHRDSSAAPATLSLATPRRDRPRRAWLSVSPSTIGQPVKASPGELFKTTADPARQRGTRFHQWFEQVGFLDDSDGRPRDDQLEQAALDLAPDMDQHQLAADIEHFKRVLQMPGIREALSRSGPRDTLWRERPFAVRDAGRLVRGRFDRVVLHRDSEAERDMPPTEATLIDFKTDRVSGDDETALRQLMDHYEPQMQAYRRALARILGLEETAITPMLLFVEAGRCRTL